MTAGGPACPWLEFADATAPQLFSPSLMSELVLSIRLAAPARLVAEPPGQALVVRTVVIFQGCPHAGWHRGAWPGIVAKECGRVARRQPKELKHPAVDRLGIDKEFVAVNDVYPLAAEHLLEPLKLLGVLPAHPVGMVAMLMAGVRGVGHQPLILTLEPGGLQLQCPLERLRLVAEGHGVGILRARPLNRVADHHEQFDPGQVTVYPLGG